jgi:outer membrane protein assembly factor BamB
LFLSITAHAQFGGGPPDFSTAGGDAQRSSWVRADPKISADALQKPGFQLIWKVKLNNEARQYTALSEAALLTRYIGYRGFRSLGFVGGSADKVFAMDTDLGRIEWQKPLTTATSTCGMTANVARPVSAAFPGGGGGRGGGGRGGAAKSGVGEPGEGSVILKEIASRAGAAGPDNAAGRRGGNTAGRGAPGTPGFPGGPGGRMRMPSYLHAISSDGMFHSMYVSNGEEPDPAIKFLPPNANAAGLIVVDNIAYAVTSGSCGGAVNAVWALDIASKQVSSWQSPSGAIAGSTGAAMGPDGTLYVATAAGELVALEAKTLKVKDIYKAGVAFTSSPLVFQHNEAALVAVAAKDGQVHVLDAAKLGGPVFKSAALTSGPDSLATWQDPIGTRYLLSTTSTSVIGLKVVDQSGTPAIETAWTREIASPLTPLVINGAVFTASRGSRSTPAVFYALDGSTGNPLWNSGKAITSFVAGGGISGGGSQVYLGTYDGTFYAFGFPIEH